MIWKRALIAGSTPPGLRATRYPLACVILASLVNLFMASSALQFVISVLGVLVFAGLTAWDTQRLKSEYLYGGMDGETSERSAILGIGFSRWNRHLL